MLIILLGGYKGVVLVSRVSCKALEYVMLFVHTLNSKHQIYPLLFIHIVVSIIMMMVHECLPFCVVVK